MERLAISLSYSTAKKFRRFAQVHDIDQYMAAKTAVTQYCKETPPQNELEEETEDGKERIFISMPDTAMRLLELWAENTGIPRTKLMGWAIRKLVEQNM